MGTKFKETKVGRIPDDWDVVKLGDVCRKITDGTHKTPAYTDQGIPFLSTTNIMPFRKGFDFSRYCKYITHSEHLELTKRCKPEKGDLLVSKCGTIGRSKLVDVDFEFSIFVGLALLKINNEIVSGEYLEQLLNYEPFQHALEIMAPGSTRQTLTINGISKVLIPLPSPPEQCKIVEILSTVDETIDKTDTIIKETQQLKKGLMQKLFIEGIGHARFKETKIGRIPEDWELLPFDDCVDKGGHTGEYRKLQTKDYLDEGRYPIIDQGQEFIAGYTNDENDVYTGSLPVTIFGDHTLFVKFGNMKFAIGADGTVLLYPNKNKLTHKFFYYLISNHKIKSEGYQRHVKYLKQKWFAIPPLPEQRKIADILSEVDAKIETEQAFKSELEQFKKGLMQVLLTGKVRVKV